MRELQAVYREHEDLISIGAYRQGSNPLVDAAIAMRDEINRFLVQQVAESCSLDQAIAELLQLGLRCAAARGMSQPPGTSDPAAATPHATTN